jgi:hypothetical protein
MLFLESEPVRLDPSTPKIPNIVVIYFNSFDLLMVMVIPLMTTTITLMIISTLSDDEYHQYSSSVLSLRVLTHVLMTSIFSTHNDDNYE